MWKSQLTKAAIFVSSKNNEEKCVIHSKRDLIEIMINDKVDKVIGMWNFNIIIFRDQIELKTSLKHSDFILDYIRLFY